MLTLTLQAVAVVCVTVMFGKRDGFQLFGFGSGEYHKK